MSLSKLVKRVDEFAAQGVKHGRKSVADFWIRFGADMTASLFRDTTLSRESFGPFQLPGPQMYEWLKVELKDMPKETLFGVFENLRMVVNQMQIDGEISPEQAVLVRRTITQVEQESGAPSPQGGS